MDTEFDDLTAIKGIGAATQKHLNARGITHYAHIAELTQEQIKALDSELGLRKAMERNDVVAQAAELLGENEVFAGADDDFVEGDPFDEIDNGSSDLGDVPFVSEDAQAPPKSVRKINPKRPYSDIIGNFHGAKYHQDGLYFDQRGVQVSIPE